MRSPEIFYIHIQGEQRGPYTIGHIDHLLNSGLITEDALFWREGLEQWQPVNQLVARRVQKKPWRTPIIALTATLILALFVTIFAPITAAGWREANQHQFTPRAAYWRARDYVRNHAIAEDDVVGFGKFQTASVEMKASGASVLLRGEVTGSNGETRPAEWQVELQYDPARQVWTGTKGAEAGRQ